MIYLDNAATTGTKPQNVINAVASALKEYSANPGRSGHNTSIKVSSAIYTAREKAADFFGASGPENVVFTMNCTHSLNCVLKGILKPGDHAVVSSLEHNAVMRPLVKTGVSFDTAAVSLFDDRLTLREFEEKIRINTRIVICTGASNVLGKILPIKQIGALCASRGILFAVDAAQTAGVIPINMKEMNIDYLCVAPHKGLYAPMGAGILICEQPVPETLIEGGTGTNSIEMFQPDMLPERLESGTIPVPAIIGTAAGIDFVKKTGMDKLYRHETELCRYLYRELEKLPGILLYTPTPDLYSYVPVISFNLLNRNSGEVAGYLNEKGIAVRSGLHCAPSAHRQIGTLSSGTVRVSVSGFNSQNDIKILLKAIKSYK